MRITTTRILGGGSDSDVCVVLNRVEPRAPETAARGWQSSHNGDVGPRNEKRIASFERNPLIFWLAKPGKSENVWVETVALAKPK